MLKRFFLKRLVFTLGAMAALFVFADGDYTQSADNIDWSKALYISPAGKDTAAGTREYPLATVQKAIAMLPDSGGGVIAFLSGTYKEMFTLRASADGVEVEMLTLTAVPGEKVVFQGGEPINEWTSYNDEKGMYIVEAPDRQSMRAYIKYLDVWENTSRVRYRRQFDVDGVRAYPGSACLLDDKHILVHTRDGRDPKAVDLWRNRKASGLAIERANVTVRDLHFANFLGGSSACAITIGKVREADYKGITVFNCSIANSVCGLNVRAVGSRIANCDIREVGLGMVSYGIDVAVENCMIQSASGSFAIGDLNQHMRNGMRYYSRARGGTIIGNVTAGFWAGFYCKCNSHLPDARPIRIENNIFLDGIRAGSSGEQPKNIYCCNIIGPNQEMVDPMKDRLLRTATFESNYFFNNGGTEKSTNKAGENPFVDLAGGDLRIKTDVALPTCTVKKTSQAISADWAVPIAKALAKSLQPDDEKSDETLRFTQTPIVVSSQQGALISARMSVPAEGVLRYRKVGETTWQKVKGLDNSLTRPAFIIGTAPVLDDSQALDFGVLFSLLNNALEVDTDYEFVVEAMYKGAPILRSEAQEFRTSGGSKEIVVRAGSDPHSAQGTKEHPFAELQAAFDQALPGDTIYVGKGVYTEPALLVHGGTPEHPVIISGVNATSTILDSGKEAPVLLELRDTGNIIIRDLQFRWFGNAGISARQTENITVERSHFFNESLDGSGTPNGSGIHLTHSPQWTISHCLFVRMEHGVVALFSPQMKLLNNTAYRNMYDGVLLHYSTDGSIITGNSFNFTGNDSMYISVPNKEALDTLICDYNNYGTIISANRISRAGRYGYVSGGKAMLRLTIGGTMHRISHLDEWHAFTGKDEHSIFVDPQFLDPLNMDFRLKPGSPNIIPDGRILGAFPVAEQE